MCLNRNLQMPQMETRSNAPSSLYAYVEPLKEETKESKKIVTKAVLSITAKQKARQAQMDKEKAKKNEDNEVGEDFEMAEGPIKNKEEEEKDKEINKDKENNLDKMEIDNNENNLESKKDKEEEKKYEILNNPARVTPNQQKYIVWCDKRYKPISKRLHGIIMVEDTLPNEEIKLVEFKTLDTQGVYGNEPEPPKPFYYLGD